MQVSGRDMHVRCKWLDGLSNKSDGGGILFDSRNQGKAREIMDCRSHLFQDNNFIKKVIKLFCGDSYLSYENSQIWELNSQHYLWIKKDKGEFICFCLSQS